MQCFHILIVDKYDLSNTILNMNDENRWLDIDINILMATDHVFKLPYNLFQYKWQSCKEHHHRCNQIHTIVVTIDIL